MTTTTTCSICSGTGIDPGFLDACAGCTPDTRSARTVHEVKPAGPTAKQLALFVTLTDELAALEPHKADKIAEAQRNFPTLSIRDASGLITYAMDCLKAARKTARAAEAPERAAGLEPGLYGIDNRIVKVSLSKAGHPYGSVLNETTKTYDYTPGSLRGITPAHRLTIEAATVVTRRIGRCCVCCRTLSNPDSVDAGIGPICAGKL